MKSISTIAAGLIAATILGVVIGRWLPTDSATANGPGSAEREILYWQAPMDPDFRRDAPGKSPMGMDLVPVYADEAGALDPALVSIDPSISSNLGVRTEPAEYGPLPRRIETVGYVGLDEETVHHVHTRVDGWIENLSITATGDPVSEGQVLFELYSPALVNAQEEYLAVLRSSDGSLRRASRDRLAALGLTPDAIDRLDTERTVRQRVRVRAESDGFVAHLGIRDGMYVTPDIELMSIANLDHVWIQVEILERQSAWVEAGQRVAVELDSLPGEQFTGTVDYVYPELDPVTRTLRARLHFDNAAEKLRPNMIASVILLGAPTAPVVHIPLEALIRGGRSDRVVLAEGDGRFRSLPVVAGIESGDRVAIKSGVAPGDRVVTSGQFLIDSESNMESALGRLAAPRTEADDTMDHDAMDHTSHDAMDHSNHDAMDHSLHNDEASQ